jgi:hypothetical protein
MAAAAAAAAVAVVEAVALQRLQALARRRNRMSRCSDPNHPCLLQGARTDLAALRLQLLRRSLVILQLPPLLVR